MPPTDVLMLANAKRLTRIGCPRRGLATSPLHRLLPTTVLLHIYKPPPPRKRLHFAKLWWSQNTTKPVSYTHLRAHETEAAH
eukprot:6491342-Amphidinium_carterae.1